MPSTYYYNINNKWIHGIYKNDDVLKQIGSNYIIIWTLITNKKDNWKFKNVISTKTFCLKTVNQLLRILLGNLSLIFKNMKIILFLLKNQNCLLCSCLMELFLTKVFNYTTSYSRYWVCILFLGFIFLLKKHRTIKWSINLTKRKY